MRQPIGLLQFPLLLEGIFHPCHCNPQYFIHVKAVLTLVCWSHCSYVNSTQMISIAARSIPLVPHQAFHGCTHWFF
jgi:hypothetical protein